MGKPDTMTHEAILSAIARLRYGPRGLWREHRDLPGPPGRQV